MIRTYRTWFGFWTTQGPTAGRHVSTVAYSTAERTVVGFVVFTVYRRVPQPGSRNTFISWNEDESPGAGSTTFTDLIHSRGRPIFMLFPFYCNTFCRPPPAPPPPRPRHRLLIYSILGGSSTTNTVCHNSDSWRHYLRRTVVVVVVEHCEYFSPFRFHFV